MRIPFVVYGVLYVMVELVGARLEEIGWPQLTPLDVATAVAHAVFTVSLAVAALLALDVLARHSRRVQRERAAERARAAAEEPQPGPVVVRSWRPAPLALTAGPSPAPFTGPDYADPGDEHRLPLYVPSEIVDRQGRRL